MRPVEATPRRLGEAHAMARIRLAAELLADHEASFLRTARRASICADDADDAFQRAAEILLTRAPEPDGRGLVAWMHVVTRREALAVARSRRRQLGAGDDAAADPDRLRSESATPEQALEARERTAVAASALATLKPQERRALALQAAGCSYAEIQAITGWTRTKVNRCLAEGRAALRRLDTLAPLYEG